MGLKKGEKAARKSVSRAKKKEAVRPSASILDALIRSLSSEDDGVRVKARHSLVAMGKTALTRVAEALKDGNSLLRWEAAKTLGEMGAPEAAPFLVTALEDEQFDVRWLAAIGLIGMNIKGLKPLLHALMEHGDSVFLRQGAHHIIHDLTKGELRKYLAPVLTALEGTEPTVGCAQAAFHALEMLEKDKRVSDIWKHSF